MKKLILSLAAACLLSATAMMAQAPNRFSYQTVVRNSTGTLLANSQVGIKISILKGTATGASQYEERHTPTTNANGLVDLQIGGGNLISGDFTTINWTNDGYFIKTEVDPTGGSAYTISGVSQLLSVPYALTAKTAEELKGGTSWTTNGANINNSNTGNVGIGTSTPTDLLQVGSYNLSKNNYISVKTSGGNTYRSGIRLWHFADNNGFTIESNEQANRLDFIRHATGSFNAMSIDRLNGNVGIGTITPSAKFQVEGSANRNSVNGFAFYAKQGVNSTYTGGAPAATVDVSIYASNRIVGSEFNAMSDARIKNKIGQSNAAEDLTTLNKISVTNYTYKDKVERGSKVIKKVIAQELEKVYPNSVSKNTDVIPDIYAMASIKEGIVSVKNDLKKGDMVKLVFEHKTELMEVLEANATSFKVNATESGKVFVYGKQVDDFRIVDYEALTTLNISATQELAKKIAALEAENAALKAVNSSFESKFDAINAKLEALAPTQTVKK